MQIFKNEVIPEQTRKIVNSFTSLNRIPQSIMLTGTNESVKNKCAYELAAAALCSDNSRPCGKCRNCKKALAKVHPDISVIEPTDGRKKVSLNDIRENVISKLYINPNEADNKVFILTLASDYSEEIQNALLKSIEEPPQDCMFIFLCDQRNDMLTTIISRTTELYIGEQPAGKPKAKDNKSAEIAEKIAAAIASGNEYLLMEATAPLGKERDLVAKTMDKLIFIIRDALTVGSGATMLSGNDNVCSLLADNYSPVALIRIKEMLDDVSDKVDANCNITLTITYFIGQAGRLIKEFYRK